MKQEVECTVCNREKPKRRVMKRKALKDVTNEDVLYTHGYREYECENEIEIYVRIGKDEWEQPIYGWVRDTCGNKMLRDPRKYKLKK